MAPPERCSTMRRAAACARKKEPPQVDREQPVEGGAIVVEEAGSKA